MKKVWIFALFCCLLSSCKETNIKKYPQACIDAFNHWDTLLEKMESSGKFSSPTMTYFKENRDFIVNNISNSTDTEKQRLLIRRCEV